MADLRKLLHSIASRAAQADRDSGASAVTAEPVKPSPASGNVAVQEDGRGGQEPGLALRGTNKQTSSEEKLERRAPVYIQGPHARHPSEFGREAMPRWSRAPVSRGVRTRVSQLARQV